jgi:hypothetical protein
LRLQPAIQSDSARGCPSRGVRCAALGHGWRNAPQSPRAVLGFLCACLTVAGGCAGGSNFLTGGPTTGQLKTSLSHLEYENQQLKRSVAKLDQENRSMEDRLVQEQIDNGDLAARLDDARNLLRDRGLDTDVRVGARRGREGMGTSDPEGVDPHAGDSSSSPPGRRRRKTPFAVISGPSDKVPQNDAGDEREIPRRNTKPRNSGGRSDDTLDHHSSYRGPSRWLPVADGTDDRVIQIR